MRNGFAEAIAALAKVQSTDAGRVLTDEHARWELYRRALAVEPGPALVLAALRAEPDLPLASATVVWALEHRGAAERGQWLEVLVPGAGRDFARRRSTELGILDSLRGDPTYSVTASDVAGWTWWLQLRVAQECDRKDVLRVLGTSGSTKRVKRLAEERLRDL